MQMMREKIDLAIIGAGPAGMAAAVEASRFGLSVIVLDENRAPGGQIYRRIESAPPELFTILGKDYAHGQALVADFRGCAARYMGGALVWNLTPDGTINYTRLEGGGEIQAKFVLLASGAMERPFPIKGWTLPGVMAAGAGQILLKDAQVLPAQPVVLAGCGPLLYLLAWQYLRAGVTLKAVVDTTAPAAYVRASRHLIGALKGWRDLAYGLKLLAAIRRQRVAFYKGADRLEIVGEEHCQGLRFIHHGKVTHIDASLVLLHQGVVPNVQLSRAVEVAHRWDEGQLCWHPVTDEDGHIENTVMFVAGDSRKIVGAKAAALQGRIAAARVAQKIGTVQGAAQELVAWHQQLRRATNVRPFLDRLYRPRWAHRIPADDVLVCRCEEVDAGQLRHYLQLGCLGPNQLKAFSRCGMGPCQGRFCGLTVTQIIAEARRVSPDEVGAYRVRPPIKPVLIGELACSHLEEL